MVRFLVNGKRRDVGVPSEQIRAAGGDVLATYASGHAVGVPDAALDAFLERMEAHGFEVRELPAGIRTAGRLIDPATTAPPAAPPGWGLFLLQYVAPPLPEWQTAVRAAGATEIMPVPERAIVVVATPEQMAKLASESWVEYHGPYLPDYKFRPVGTDHGKFTIQIVDTAVSKEAVRSIEARVGGFISSSVSDHILTATFLADRSTASDLVNERFVLGVESYVELQPSDERQGLSLTGEPNLPLATTFANNKSGTGTNYLRWLSSYGITPNSLTQSGIVVDIADSGIINGCSGTTTHLRTHWDLRGRVVYHNGTTVPLPGGGTTELGVERTPDYTDDYGHGTVIASIVAGNPGSGLDTNNQGTAGFGTLGLDPQNYYWGLGVAPGIRLGSTVIVDSGGVPYGNAVRDWTSRAVQRRCNTPGAPCTSTTIPCPATVQNHSHNEYEPLGTNAGYYTTTASLFDRSVRNADHASGLPLAITVSAGNIRQGADDPSTMVLGPATAKNVISVGGTESDRDSTVCNTSGYEPAKRHLAQDYRFLAYLSRRGTIDNRLKPDVLAPATLATGAHSYEASVYCLTSGGSGFDAETSYRKPFYSGSSGTSFAAPVAAGSVALLEYVYERLAPPQKLVNPSPAMYKAMLIAGARSMTGGVDSYTGTAITKWPNAQQGFGAIALEPLFQTGVLRGHRDQQPAPLLQGASSYFTVTTGDPTKPVRIVLAWTDKEGPVQMPGTSWTKALVNDLDLRATWPDGLQYYGNVTNAAGYSYVPGCGRPLCPSPADVLNNVEVLNIDPLRFVDPTKRTFTVRVWAAVLNGVGVPGASFGANNQDFALFVMNGTLTPNP